MPIAQDPDSRALKDGRRAARLAALLLAIEAGYTDPAFSIVALAGHAGLSVRYVRALLQQSGEGFAERVTELRLRHAWRLLSDRGTAGRRIADLALAAGFGDISYFNRCFRRRFGCTPGAVREGLAPSAGAARRPE